jgi:hypothetical protein
MEFLRFRLMEHPEPSLASQEAAKAEAQTIHFGGSPEDMQMQRALGCEILKRAER